jgi:hypothetical protein
MNNELSPNENISTPMQLMISAPTVTALVTTPMQPISVQGLDQGTRICPSGNDPALQG